MNEFLESVCKAGGTFIDDSAPGQHRVVVGWVDSRSLSKEWMTIKQGRNQTSSPESRASSVHTAHKVHLQQQVAADPDLTHYYYHLQCESL